MNLLKFDKKMNISKYDGNIHPDEWISDIANYFILMETDFYDSLMIAKSLVDPAIKVPASFETLEELVNALKKDISFTVFKSMNKKMLKSLRYIPESEGGRTSNFISTFRKLCYNSEISDMEEQKKYFCHSLMNDNLHYNYFFDEFLKRKERINSMNDLIKEFDEIVMDESDLIRNESIVTLKHVATGKYLSSIVDLHYTTGSGTQAVFIGDLDQNSLWKITFDNELATYNNTSINLKLTKSNNPLGLCHHYTYGDCNYYKSPLTEHTEVSCNGSNESLGYRRIYQDGSWKFKHSKLENHQGYLKSNDTINLCINKETSDEDEFLRSHNIQFTIGNNTLQEVVCHNERLGENDEWCIELIKQGQDLSLNM